MSITDRFRELAGQAQPVSVGPHKWAPKVTASATMDDLGRVLALPRRPIPSVEDQSNAAAQMTALLRRDNPKCCCSELRPEVIQRGQNCCITELRPLQGWYLMEASKNHGAIGFIPVGGGKTALDILLPMVVPCRLAILLIRPQDVEQLRRDMIIWSQHFYTPNLADGSLPFRPNAPTLEILPYSKLSRPEQTAYLTARNPDLIIADEAQALKDRNAARTSRFLRYFAGQSTTKFCCHSGSLTTRTLLDVCHLSGLGLKEKSPLPLYPAVAEAWANAVDPKNVGIDPGSLRTLKAAGETLEHALHRRIVETKGVISTNDVNIDAPLLFARRPATMPEQLAQALSKVRNTWIRPDGEELTNALEVSDVCLQLACGFFYRWKFPRGEPKAVILDWFDARQDWNREVRDALKQRSDGMDSPKLLRDAACRSKSGYVGPLPVWRSHTLARWMEVEDTVHPETEVVWMDDYLLDECVQWLKEGPGICWYEFTEFGKQLAEKSGCTRYGGGPQSAAPLLSERGNRAVIVSRNAHGTGKNLQAFARQLWPNPPSDGGAWEQGIGRSHRYGQNHPVTINYFDHTVEHKGALHSAKQYAKYIQAITGNPQKLLYGEWK